VFIICLSIHFCNKEKGTRNAKKLNFHVHARGNTPVCLALDVNFIFGVSLFKQ
jgi:hypothetical protein